MKAEILSDSALDEFDSLFQSEAVEKHGRVDYADWSSVLLEFKAFLMHYGVVYPYGQNIPTIHGAPTVRKNRGLLQLTGQILYGNSFGGDFSVDDDWWEDRSLSCCLLTPRSYSPSLINHIQLFLRRLDQDYIVNIVGDFPKDPIMMRVVVTSNKIYYYIDKNLNETSSNDNHLTRLKNRQLKRIMQLLNIRSLPPNL